MTPPSQSKISPVLLYVDIGSADFVQAIPSTEPSALRLGKWVRMTEAEGDNNRKENGRYQQQDRSQL